MLILATCYSGFIKVSLKVNLYKHCNMKNLAKIFALILICMAGTFTACESAAIDDEQGLYEDFQGVDRSVQRPGSQGNNGDGCDD